MPVGTHGLQYHPKCQLEVQREKDRIRRAVLRQRMNQHKESIGCCRCGYRRFGGALDWHHIEDNKERRITVRSYFTALGEAERAKCILLCANCHREEHHA